MTSPRTLQEAIVYFADPDNCIKFFGARRWPNGVECPTCGSKDVSYISTRRMWECKKEHARKQFSIKVGSIFEDSALGLDKWLVSAWMICNCKNGVSSCEIARSIGVTQKTAWFMAPPHPQGHADRLLYENWGQRREQRRSGRNLYRRQGPQHARLEARTPDHRHGRQGQGGCDGHP